MAKQLLRERQNHKEVPCSSSFLASDQVVIDHRQNTMSECNLGVDKEGTIGWRCFLLIGGVAVVYSTGIHEVHDRNTQSYYLNIWYGKTEWSQVQ